MGTSLDALNAPSSLTARRQAAGNLPNFELPPPSNLHFGANISQRFPPLSTTNLPQPPQSSNIGHLLTPPSNSASESSSTSSGMPSGNTPNTQAFPVLPYTPTNIWQGTTPNGFHTGFTPQPWQGSNPLFPPRSMFSPFGSLMRNNSNSPTAGESQTLPPPPYDLTALPPFQHSMPTSSGVGISSASPQQQQAMTNPLSGRGPQLSPVTSADGLQKLPPTPNLYQQGSTSSATSQHSTYPYPGPSPVQQSPRSANASISRVSPQLHQNGLPQTQMNHFMRPPQPSYSLPAMPGPIMTNVSNPGGPMQMMGTMHTSGLPTSYHSGFAANPTSMYGNGRANSPQQANNDRPFKCDQCPQSFNRNHDLKRHKRIHLAVKPFPCGHCDKSFSRKDALKRHILVKGCGKRSVDSIANEDGAVKSESGSDLGSISPIIQANP